MHNIAKNANEYQTIAGPINMVYANQTVNIRVCNISPFALGELDFKRHHNPL